MEWVETTGKTIEEAKERALDQLGVGDEDAEFEILEEPRAGLFGLIRGEARVRARVRPTEVRPKQDRRRGRRERGSGGAESAPAADASGDATSDTAPVAAPVVAETSPVPARSSGNGRSASTPSSSAPQESEVDPAVVGEAAAQFVGGLVDAFGLHATTAVTTEGSEIEVTVDGDGLGLLIGPGGRTLLAVQDLTRVAAQRRLGDHETRLRVDVAGYRERRRIALERFARQVAEQVRETGVARALEPMPSADRKIIHDVVAGIDGVSSRSDGEEPQRRIVVVPAG